MRPAPRAARASRRRSRRAAVRCSPISRCPSRRPTSSRCSRRFRGSAWTWWAPSSPAAVPCSSSRSTRRPASKCRWWARASSRKACSGPRARPPKASRQRCITATASTIPRTPRSARPSRTRPAATPTSMPCRATTRPSSWRSASRRSRATSRTRPTSTRRCAPPRSNRRAVPSACPPPRTSRSTSTCARPRAARTRWWASPSRTWPTPAPAASWREQLPLPVPLQAWGEVGEGRRQTPRWSKLLPLTPALSPRAGRGDEGVHMDLPGLLAQLLNGVQYGLLLFLIASGLTLIFGVMGIINLAHGSLFMIGAYVAFLVTRVWGSVWVALPVAFAGGILLGLVLERGLFRFFYAREHLDQVLLTFALILLFEEGRSLLVGNDFYSVPVPALFDFSVPITAGFSYSAYRFAVIGICLGLALLLFWLIERTRMGAVIRAAAEKPEMVDVLGIDARLVHMSVFALGTALALVAGVLAAPLYSVYPNMGDGFLIISFVVVVIGGLGSVSGAFWSALIIGLVDTLGKAYAPKLAGLAVYVLMAFVLIWRPSGLFGQRT